MIIPSGYAQVNWIFTGNSAPRGAEVTMGIDLASFSGTTQDGADLASAAWAATVLADQTSSVTLSRTRFKRGPNVSGAFAEKATTSAGGIGSSAMPPQVSLLITKVTATGGRSGRGRSFMPGVTEVDIGPNGELGTAYLADVQDKWDDLKTALEAADLFPVLLHADNTGDVTPHPITGFQVQALVATQRRRLRG